MKKLLLMISAVMMSVGALFAQDANAPKAYPSLVITAMSEDGNYVCGQEVMAGTLTVINRSTGESFTTANDEGMFYYSVGLGNCMSNTGIVVCSQTDACEEAGYCLNGEWYVLPKRPEDVGVALAHGITPDGSRICGQVGRASFGLEDNLMQQPVIWNRNADGTYADYVELPYPTKDFVGLMPQYVTAVAISADGKTIAGQVTCNSGFLQEPIIYREAEDGTWSYTLIHNKELFNPNDVVLPEYPGECPEYPNPSDYMTEEEIEAYNVAVEEYNQYTEGYPNKVEFMTAEEYAQYQEALENYTGDGPYPWPDDFMTAEELTAYEDAVNEYYENMPPYPSMEDYMGAESKAKYDEAMAQYNAAYNEWEVKYYEYAEVYDSLLDAAPSFQFNSVYLSPNGRYLSMTDLRASFFGPSDPAVPYLFDLENGDYKTYGDKIDASVTFVSDNGSMLAAARLSLADNKLYTAYVCSNPEEGDFVLLQDYVKSVNEDVYNWMNTNMRHTYEEYELDEETWDYVPVIMEDALLTGLPTANGDLSCIATWVPNVWGVDYELEVMDYYYSYILPLGKTTGVFNAASDNISFKALRGGLLEVKGAAKTIEIYDVNGRMVYRVDSPASRIATGLGNGIYVIKTTANNGKVSISKAAF